MAVSFAMMKQTTTHILDYGMPSVITSIEWQIVCGTHHNIIFDSSHMEIYE